METEIAVPQEFGLSVARDPNAVLAEAKRAAEALKRVLDSRPKESKVMINGVRYLEYEDWSTIAKFYGVTAKIVSTSPVEVGSARGWEAKAVAFHAPTGQEISAADSMCLNDERNWSIRGKETVPSFQLRSMAQTRACAKVLKNVFSWVVVLAGYAPTPAEEMTGKEKAQPIKDPEPKADMKAEFIPVRSTEKPDKKGRVRWAIMNDKEEWYSTYEPEAGNLICQAREKKQAVVITYKKEGEFNNIVTAKLA